MRRFIFHTLSFLCQFERIKINTLPMIFHFVKFLFSDSKKKTEIWKEMKPYLPDVLFYYLSVMHFVLLWLIRSFLWQDAGLSLLVMKWSWSQNSLCNFSQTIHLYNKNWTINRRTGRSIFGLENNSTPHWALHPIFPTYIQYTSSSTSRFRATLTCCNNGFK